MLNKKPIFIVGFQRGGTNIILNLLRSHPNVCSPMGETHEAFKGKGNLRNLGEPLVTYIKKRLNYYPIMLEQREDIFDIDMWAPRKQFSCGVEKKIDRTFYKQKINAIELNQNYYKSENIKYSLEELKSARLLCKNLNGLIFITRELFNMYSDATFIAIVRNGFALCEGHIRRGAKPEKIARQYHIGCQKIIEDSKIYCNYFIVRFEDIISKPHVMYREIYSKAALNISEVKKIRMEAKATINKYGQHKVPKGYKFKDLKWHDINQFSAHLKNNINDLQIKQLSIEQFDTIKRISFDSLKYFGYLHE